MAKLKIVKIGDPVLRGISRPVEKITPRTIQLLDDMIETMRAADGVGLAAPQVGVLRRIFIVMKGETLEDGVIEFINPEIVSQSGEQYDTEGCLSVPGKWGEVKRPYKVTVKFLDRYGKSYKLTAEGFMARAICHENDHLNGVIYVDKADNLRSDNK